MMYWYKQRLLVQFIIGSCTDLVLLRNMRYMVPVMLASYCSLHETIQTHLLTSNLVLKYEPPVGI
jgi:hypothetical protein